MILVKNIKILLALTAGFLVIAFGLYFDGKSNNSSVEQEALMPNFDDILSQINSIEFKRLKIIFRKRERLDFRKYRKAFGRISKEILIEE